MVPSDPFPNDVAIRCHFVDRAVAPLPDDVTIPIKLADGFVLKYRRHTRDHAGLAAGHIGELDHDVSAGTADQRRVEHATREAPMTPAPHLVTAHIDEVGLVVPRRGTAEQDEDVVGLSRIVARYAGGI